MLEALLMEHGPTARRSRRMCQTISANRSSSGPAQADAPPVHHFEVVTRLPAAMRIGHQGLCTPPHAGMSKTGRFVPADRLCAPQVFWLPA
jgi:hypothetical protein